MLAIVVAIGVLLAVRYLPLIDDFRLVRASAVALSAEARALDPAAIDRPTLERLRGEVASLETRLDPLRMLVEDDPVAAALRIVPGLGAQLEAAGQLVDASGSLLEASRLGLDLADRMVTLREANAADPTVAVLPGLVEIMATSTDEVERIADLVATARARLATFPSGALAQLSDARALIAAPLDEYGPLLDAYRDVDDALPGILGWGGKKRYLVLAQNPAELRPTGGYNGTVGVVTLRDGAVVEQSFVDAHLSGFQDDLPFVEAPEALRNHLLGDDQPWRVPDANWWADFPTSARQSLELYAIETGDEDFDGVIAITTYALDQLLEVVGPVTVEDLTVEPGDATIVLLDATRVGEDGTNVGRKAILDDLAREVMRRLLSLPPDRWLPMLRALDEMGRQEMVLAWFRDPEAQAVVELAGWDGRVRDDAGDYVYVVEANMAPTSKYNLVVERSRSLHVDLARDGSALSSIRLDWRNHAARPGEPYASLREFSTDQDGVYGAHVRLLVPAESELITASGEGSEEIRGPESVGVESGRAVFANYLLMPPGESRLTYLWSNPAAAVETAEGWEYVLTLQRQPGARPEPVSVRVDLPDGARVIETSEGAAVEEASVAFDLRLETDERIRVRYTLPSDVDE